MNTESQLKLQAYLDGELAGPEARQVAAWLEKDRDAQALLGELKQTRAELKGNEPEAKVPESREFYWSKIQREILRAERAEGREAAQVSTMPWWRKYWAPLCTASAVAALMILTLNPLMLSRPGVEEFENPLEEASTLTYRSEKEKTTVVWLVSQNDDAADDLELDETVTQ
jgi:anti-sigma factor RsiW